MSTQPHELHPTLIAAYRVLFGEPPPNLTNQKIKDALKEEIKKGALLMDEMREKYGDDEMYECE